MLEESSTLVCPNPKCQREIKKAIAIKILSISPMKKYEACPYCFSRLEQPPLDEQHPLESIPDEASKPEIEPQQDMKEEKETQSQAEDSVSQKVEDTGSSIMEKVKALIPTPNESQTEKKEKRDETQAESRDKEIQKEAPETEPDTSKTSGFSGCPKAFGYLANRSSDAPIPPDCMLCPRIVECMLKVESE